MTVRCNACGEVWARDPALEVECPNCRAAPGSPCRRPSGHGCAVHAARDRLAMQRGFLAPCPAPRLSAPEDSISQLSLFSMAADLPPP